MTPTALGAYRGVAFVSTTGDLPLPDRERFLGVGHAGSRLRRGARRRRHVPRLPPLPGHARRGIPSSRPGDDGGAPGEGPGPPGDTRDPPGLSVVDEIYQFQRYDPGRVHLLLALDRHPETGVPGEYPLAWTRHHGRGRVFSTALGHRVDVLEAPWFQTHRLGGIPWALGLGVSGRWAAPHA